MRSARTYASAIDPDVRIDDVPARRASRAAGAVLVLRLAGAATGVVVAGILTRDLGPDRFGELSLLLTVGLLATSLAELGSTQVVVAEMAARPQRRAELAVGYATLRVIAGLGTAFAGLVAVLALVDVRSAGWAGAAVLATVPLAGISGLAALATARVRPQVGAALSLAQSAAWFLAVLAVADVDGGLLAYGLAFLASVVVQAVLTWTVVVRGERVAWARWRPASRWLLHHGWPLAVAGVLGTLYYRVDTLFVFRLAGAAEGGFYAAGYRFLDVLQLVPAAVAAVALPLLARSWADGDGTGAGGTAGAAVLRRALTVCVAASVPVGVGGVLFGDRVAIGIFGSEFARAGEVLAVLGLAFPSIATGYVYASVLVAAGDIRAIGRVAAVAVLVTVVANPLVVPRWGAVGAAWVTVAVEYLVSTSLAVRIARRHGLAFPWDRLRAAAVAAAVMGAATWSVRDAPLPVLLLTAAVSYAGAALALGVVGRDEVLAP